MVKPYWTDKLSPGQIHHKPNLWPHVLFLGKVLNIESINAIKKSPTAKGCAEMLSMFVQGEGFSEGGDMVVNRDGDTMNDVLTKAVKDYSEMNGVCIHLNFNITGQITEIFPIDIKYVRKSKDLCTAQFGVWNNQSWYNRFVSVDLYNPEIVVDKIKLEGINNYNGQLLYFTKGYDIYPDSPLDSASISASFEKEVQIYQYASINNGFSASGVLKVPTMGQGEKADKNIDNAQKNLEKIKGANNSGSVIAMPTPVDTDGKFQASNLYESFAPHNIDSLFVNQNGKAKENILSVYRMPEILLGTSSQGMFNQASYNDAFDYKNADTERDRKIVERVFQKVVDNSVFPIPQIEIVPLEMKTSQVDEVVETISAEGTPINTGNETLRSLSGKQKAQMLREITKYKNEKISRSQLDVFLRSYGLDDDEIEKMIGDEL